MASPSTKSDDLSLTGRIEALRDEIEALMVGITPEPWHAATSPHPAAVRARKEAVSVYGPDCLIYSMSRDYVCLPETWDRQKRDAKFIAAAPRLVRELLSAILASGTRQGQETEK